MGMPAKQTEWTAEMARALPEDGNRYEVLDGELHVTPAPGMAHQEVLKRLFRRIDPYVEQHYLGWIFWSPADIEFTPKRRLQPDLFVVPNTGAAKPREWSEVKSLLLVIEALSPTTESWDRFKKRPIYQQHQVPQYWIVDVDSRLVERWRPEDQRPEIIDDVLIWQPKAEVPALRIVLDEIFRSADV
jgi:Uma2 family endonuclease